MSQAGSLKVLDSVLPSDVPINFVTNSGTAVSTANTLNVLGGGETTTSGAGNTVTITAPNPVINTDSGTATSVAGAFTISGAGGTTTSGSGSTVVINGSGGGGGGGATTFPTNSGTAVQVAGVLNVLGAGSILSSAAGNTVTVQVTGLTNHAVLVGSGGTTITKVGPTATAGQVLQSAGAAADPSFSTPTYPSASGSAGVILRSDGTNNVYTTATYPNTTTINQILFSSAANTISGLATANNGVLTTGATGVPAITALASNGQLIIGSGAGAPAAATLTAGTGITVTNGANSITLAVDGSVVGETITGNSGGALSPTAGNWNIVGGTGVSTSGAGSTLTINFATGGFTWTDATNATYTLAVQNGYVTDKAAGVTYTLPATANLGDTFKIVGRQGLTTITPNANQQLLIGSASGTVGATGTAVGTNAGDCITFVAIFSGANTLWRADSFVGNWTLS